MYKLQLVNLFILIEVSWQMLVPSSIPVVLVPKDYSKHPVMTSSLPRSNETAERMSFNWNDIFLESDILNELHPEKVDVAKGLPDYLPAQTILNGLVQVAQNFSHPLSYKYHQYTRSMGYPRLAQIVAKFYSHLMNRQLNPWKEVLITAGSINSMELLAKSFINQGDEIVLFEPYYFLYRNMFNPYGVKLVPCPLIIKPGTHGTDSIDWTFDKAELESKINKKTKFILLNNPNNPLGKVYTLEELNIIADIAKKFNILVIADEAGQWYQYDGPGHTRIATLPGMFERTLTLTSGGKLFTNTGWRIAWVIAPENLLWGMATNIGLGMASVPLQIAYAMGMEQELLNWGTPQSYFNQLQPVARSSRNKLVGILRSVGADVINPSAGYCVVANFTKLVNQIDITRQTDPRPGFKFWKYMLIEQGIFTYPMTLFYDEKNLWKSEYSLRFTNLKTPQTFDYFEQLLIKIFKKMT